MSEKTVSVKVNVAKEEQKEISDISVQTINLGEGLKVKALGKENSFISVIVKGSKEALDKVESSNIRATVDLSEYTTPGEYEVDVKVSGDDLKLSYTSKTKKIKVEIYK